VALSFGYRCTRTCENAFQVHHMLPETSIATLTLVLSCLRGLEAISAADRSDLQVQR
jgi:hypothetical protein